MPATGRALKKKELPQLPQYCWLGPTLQAGSNGFPLVRYGARKRAASLPRAWLACHCFSSVSHVSLLVSDFHVSNYSSMSRVFPMGVEGFTKVHITFGHKYTFHPPNTHRVLMVSPECLCTKHCERPAADSHYLPLLPLG